MVRFATVEDYAWIAKLLEDIPVSRWVHPPENLEELIRFKQVIVETDEHSVAAFTPCEDCTEVLFNVTNPAYSAVQTSSAVLSTYLLYKYRLPLRYCMLQSAVEEYFATKKACVRDLNTLMGEKEIGGRVYNCYEFKMAGL